MLKEGCEMLSSRVTGAQLDVKMDRFAEFLANSGERSSSSKSGSVGNPSLIVVFDFDHTLAAEHMYYELRSERGLARQRYEPEGFYEWIFGGETRLDLLCDCLLALHTAGATLRALEWCGGGNRGGPGHCGGARAFSPR